MNKGSYGNTGEGLFEWVVCKRPLNRRKVLVKKSSRSSHLRTRVKLGRRLLKNSRSSSHPLRVGKTQAKGSRKMDGMTSKPKGKMLVTPINLDVRKG